MSNRRVPLVAIPNGANSLVRPAPSQSAAPAGAAALNGPGATALGKRARPVAEDDSLEEIRQWQRHYKKAFPEFVFYFESIPDEDRHRISRQLRVLGSKEEKFFSRLVTHVVTTRPIPPPETGAAERANNQIIAAHDPAAAARGSQQAASQNIGDVLVKSREMGIKIWSLEKIQRIMATMFETDTGEQPLMKYDNIAGQQIENSRPLRNADLSQLLQNEKQQNGRDQYEQLTFFRGFFVYVHDQDEKTRPIIVRDYGKPQSKEEGLWPQFRLTGPGRCPFVEDYYDRKVYKIAHERAAAASRAAANSAAKMSQTQAQAQAIAHTQVSLASNNASVPASIVSRAAPDAVKDTHSLNGTPTATDAVANGQKNATLIPAESATASQVRKRPAPEEAVPPPPQRLRRSARTAASAAQDAVAPNGTPVLGSIHMVQQVVPKPGTLAGAGANGAVSSRQSSAENLPPAFTSHRAVVKGRPRTIRGEPVASGIQPSNITSAIRSQMVSSAAGVGARGGTSKELHQLQRKVLATTTTSASTGPGPSSFVNDSKAASQTQATAEAPAPRAAKVKAQESLKRRTVKATVSKSASKKKSGGEAKAGYCENCQDKFPDFKAHVQTRKHRAFATTPENWKELDSLLGLLQRNFPTS